MPSPKPLQFTKKENATLQQHIEILNWYHQNGKNQSKTAKHFDPIYPNLRIKQPLISSWLKDEAKWWEEWENNTGSHAAKRLRQTQHPDVTEMMDLWVVTALENKVLLTGDVLHEKWVSFANRVGIPEDERLHLSNGWLDSFKKRHHLKSVKCHGEAGSANPDVVQKEQQRIQDLIKSKGYALKDVFNMDETGLFYA